MEQLLIHVRNSVAYVTLNRPEKRNALTPAMLERLLKFLGSAEQQGVRCLVIQGTGEKAFSAGFDMDKVGGKEVREEGGEATIVDRAYDALEAFPYPVIAAVRGYAIGAGFELTAACDIRIASETARMGMPPAKLGLVYRPFGYRRLLRVMGEPLAKLLFFSAQLLPAQELQASGFVHRVVPDAEFEGAVADLAQAIALNAPISLKGSKAIIQSLTRAVDFDLPGLNAARAWRQLALDSWDLQEGKQAFREHRRPQFTGS